MGLSIPTKWIHWLGQFASAGFINTIPDTATGGSASQQLGFPPLTSQAVGAGGVPPNIGDFNGINAYFSQWIQWLQSGAPQPYDATFQSNIGGYPLGSVVMSATTPLKFWISTVANNTTNPDTGGAGWVVPILGQTNTFSQPQTFTQSSLSGATVFNGSTSSSGANIELIGNGGTTPNKYIRVLNGVLQFVNSAYSVVTGTLDDAGNLSVPASIGAGTSITAATSISGANISASQAISAGTTITSGGEIVSNSNGIVAVNGNMLAGLRMRGTYGAYLSGDVNACTILNDFQISVSSVFGYMLFPNGFMIQWGQYDLTNGNNQLVNLYTSFPNACASVVAGLASAPITGNYQHVGGSPGDASQIYLAVQNPPNSPTTVTFIALGY
jgi:hypothetical protein